ncbi:hypothetical protein PRNP1_015635 [Phytophthora ramorum]
MEVLSNEELLGECGDAAFVASALCDSDDTDEDLETEVHEDPLTALTTTDKTGAIRSVIFMLTEHPDVEMKVLSGLRTLQARLRKQQREEQEESWTQTSICVIRVQTARVKVLRYIYAVAKQIPDGKVNSKRRQVNVWKKLLAVIERKCAQGAHFRQRGRSLGMGSTLFIQAEDQLVRWINELRTDGVPVTGMMLKLQAQELYQGSRGLPGRRGAGERPSFAARESGSRPR